MSALGDNRLAVLAANIRDAHAGVREAARTAAERAIDAGRMLTEAKALLKHGQWLPWLKDHCQLSERTAQLYMRVAKLGLKSETVADLGLRAAAKVVLAIHDTSYNVFAGCGEEAQRQWLLFGLFGIPWQHIEWLRQRPFATPDEWLGEEGAKFRRTWGMREPSGESKAVWTVFQTTHHKTPRAEIEARLGADAAP